MPDYNSVPFDAQRIEHSSPAAVLPAQAPSDPGDVAPLTSEASAQCAADAGQAGSDASPKPPATRREFERALRAQLGYSKRAAAAIAANGFRAGNGAHADGDPDDMQSLVAALQRRARAIEGN